MSIYLGYYRPTATYREANETRARQGDTTLDPKFAQIVVDLPLKLPAGCSILGSFAPAGGSPDNPPNVMIIETSDTAHLGFISNYYAGYLQFQWFPATSVGANKNQREEWRQAAAAPPAVTR
ncbi:MAG: hypothetical protein IPI33_00215 [Dehalococcoidia bacterium]|nr:hypothetical protein [Dehalococcoidia bacterium]